jgi:hypothetical protein
MQRDGGGVGLCQRVREWGVGHGGTATGGQEGKEAGIRVRKWGGRRAADEATRTIGIDDDADCGLVGLVRLLLGAPFSRASSPLMSVHECPEYSLPRLSPSLPLPLSLSPSLPLSLSPSPPLSLCY